jgi:hypothetical protein
MTQNSLSILFYFMGMDFVGMIHESNITLLNTFHLAPRVKGLKYVRVGFSICY